jgi:hypothetical protein
MSQEEKKYNRSKLGQLISDRGMTLREFAADCYEKTGYFIAVTNLSNYCTGLKQIKTIEIAKHFAETLEVPITEIL